MPQYKKYIETTTTVKGKPVKAKRYIGVETHTEVSAKEINDKKGEVILILKK